MVLIGVSITIVKLRISPGLRFPAVRQLVIISICTQWIGLVCIHFSAIIEAIVVGVGNGRQGL